MIPLALFLLGCATVFLGAIQAAFSALMRLSLRLMAERGGRSDRLGRYLDDPLQLFVPVRLLIGLCVVLIAFVIVCEHLIPSALARRDPERLLDILLPAFTPIARLAKPLTHALL